MQPKHGNVQLPFRFLQHFENVVGDEETTQREKRVHRHRGIDDCQDWPSLTQLLKTTCCYSCGVSS
jgi:hypothetical protein